MIKNKINRRLFLKNTTLAATAITLGARRVLAGSPSSSKNLLPRWKGFNLLDKGVGVHCGECGCWKKTPHNIFLAWFGDIADILTKNGIGYALWNFRGDFGILDSGRTDVNYTDWYSHKLDSKLLDLLKKY